MAYLRISPYRHYFKTLTYCLMHFIVAVLVAYALTRNWALALGIGLLEPLVQTAFFHLHERFWDQPRTALVGRS